VLIIVYSGKWWKAKNLLRHIAVEINQLKEYKKNILHANETLHCNWHNIESKVNCS